MVRQIRRPLTTAADFEAAGLATRTRRDLHGGHERRSAERYESRVESPAKDAQREAVRDWLVGHHPPGSRMRLLTLPDERWTFENRMNDRPDTSFLGLQRDWRTLERSVPWMPMSDGQPSWSPESRASHFYATGRNGDMQGYRRGKNILLHMWAGHLLSWDNIGRKGDRELAFRKGIKKARGLRHVTAAWLDFTGSLTDEVVAAAVGIPTVLGGTPGGTFPVVVSFLACRDAFRDHESRVARVLIAIQQDQRPGPKWRFRFDRFEVHAGTSPFLSIFGAYHRIEPATPPEAPPS